MDEDKDAAEAKHSTGPAGAVLRGQGKRGATWARARLDADPSWPTLLLAEGGDQRQHVRVPKAGISRSPGSGLVAGPDAAAQDEESGAPSTCPVPQGPQPLAQ